MLYVSKITDKLGNSLDNFKYKLSIGHSYDLSFADTENSLDLMFVNTDECLGISEQEQTDTGVVVAMQLKEVLFHRYVGCSRTVNKTAPVPFESVDFVNYPHYSSDVSRGHGTLDIRMDYQQMALLGRDGSVVSYQGDWAREKVRGYCSLYDFVSYICRKTGVNLLKYELIQFGSKSLGWSVILWLTHNEESERFYTKMYMDIVGGYAGRLRAKDGSGLF